MTSSQSRPTDIKSDKKEEKSMETMPGSPFLVPYIHPDAGYRNTDSISREKLTEIKKDITYAANKLCEAEEKCRQENEENRKKGRKYKNEKELNQFIQSDDQFIISLKRLIYDDPAISADTKPQIVQLIKDLQRTKPYVIPNKDGKSTQISVLDVLKKFSDKVQDDKQFWEDITLDKEDLLLAYVATNYREGRVEQGGQLRTIEGIRGDWHNYFGTQIYINNQRTVIEKENGEINISLEGDHIVGETGKKQDAAKITVLYSIQKTFNKSGTDDGCKVTAKKIEVLVSSKRRKEALDVLKTRILDWSPTLPVTDDDKSFYTHLAIFLSESHEQDIRKAFYEKVASFPKAVQLRIDSFVSQMWDEPWFNLSKKMSKEALEAEKDKIIAIEEARLAASHLENLLFESDPVNEHLPEKVNRILEKILPYVHLKEVRKALFESQISFPKYVRDTIDDRVRDNLQEKKEDTSLSDEKGTTLPNSDHQLDEEKRLAKIQRITRAYESVEKLDPERPDFNRELEGILLFLVQEASWPEQFGEEFYEKLRENFYKKWLNFSDIIQAEIQIKIDKVWDQDWFKLARSYGGSNERFREERARIMSTYLTYFINMDAGSNRDIFFNRIRTLILPYLGKESVRDAFYGNASGFPEDVQNEIERYFFHGVVLPRGVRGQDLTEARAKQFAGYLDPNEKVNAEKIKNILVPGLQNADVRKFFYNRYSQMSYENQNETYKIIKEGIEAEQRVGFIERHTLLYDLRVLRDTNYVIRRRIKRDFYKIFDLNDKSSGWEIGIAVVSKFYKLPELFLETLEDAALFCIDRTLGDFGNRNQPGGSIPWALMVASVFAVVGLIVELPARLLLQRLTSPIRSAKEAYAFGESKGGWVFGFGLGATSIAISLGLLTIAAVFAAPFVASALIAAKAGAIVTGVQSALSWLSAVGLSTLEVNLVSVAAAALSIWGVTQLASKLYEKVFPSKKLDSENDKNSIGATPKAEEIVNHNSKRLTYRVVQQSLPPPSPLKEKKPSFASDTTKSLSTAEPEFASPKSTGTTSPDSTQDESPSAAEPMLPPKDRDRGRSRGLSRGGSDSSDDK